MTEGGEIEEYHNPKKILLEKQDNGTVYAQIKYNDFDEEHEIKIFKDGSEGWKTDEDEFDGYKDKESAINVAKKWWEDNKGKYIYSAYFTLPDGREDVITAAEVGYVTSNFNEFGAFYIDWDDIDITYLDGSSESFTAEEKGGISTTRQREEDAEKVDDIREYVVKKLIEYYNIKDRKYQDLGVIDEKGNLIGTFQLRIADHSENPRNIDWYGGSRDYFLSVVFASYDPTSGLWDLERRTGSEKQITINETYTNETAFDYVDEAIEDAIDIVKYKNDYEGKATITADFEFSETFQHFTKKSCLMTKDGEIEEYYTSSSTHPFSEFIELEVLERENQSMEEVNAWKKKYNLTDNSRVIWVTPNKRIAHSYNIASERWDEIQKATDKELKEIYAEEYGLDENPDDYISTISAKDGFIIPESDDGDEGFIFVFDDKLEKGGKTPATFNPANPQQYLKQGGSILSLSDEPDLFEKSERERIVKLSDINTDVDLFQNREGEFSQETVDSIKQAVHDGTFDWVEFDAIMIWKNPKDNKYYVLAGHSRLQAAKELKNEGYEEFGQLPAKIKKGTLEEAQEFARTRSNIMGTKESDIARAKVYRRMRKEGKKESEIIEAAKKNEGKNWVLIHNISALNPNGKSIATLRQFEQSSDIEMRSKAEAVADWVGEARNKYRELSDTHEAEIYEYLWSAYSKKKAAGKITNKTAFSAMLEMVIDRAKAQDMFHPEVSLNIKGAVGKSDIELEYDSEIAALIKAEKEARSTLDEKRADLLVRGATRDDMDRVLPKYEATLQKAITELSEARSRKGLVKTAARQQTDIFSQIEEAPLIRIKSKLLQFAELLTGKPINRQLVRMGKGGEITDSENFKKWFGESKVVDENGNPLVVYHGTDDEFTEFDTTESIGAWFTHRKEIAENLFNRKKKHVSTVYLSIKNPYIIETTPSKTENLENDSWVKLLNKYEKYNKKAGNRLYMRGQYLKEDLIKKGYDGIILKNSNKDTDIIRNRPTDQIIAFSPTQIKSIHNLGTFDPDNPDITMEKGGEIKSKLIAFSDLITSEAEKSRNALPGNEQKFVDKLIADTKAGITYNKPKLEKLANERGIKEQNLAKELAELAVVIMAREIALNDKEITTSIETSGQNAEMDDAVEIFVDGTDTSAGIYIEGDEWYFPSSAIRTNNDGEMMAILLGVKYAIHRNIPNVIIYTDSQIAQQIVSMNWSRQKHLKAKAWVVNKFLDKAKLRGQKIEIEWIPGEKNYADDASRGKRSIPIGWGEDFIKMDFDDVPEKMMSGGEVGEEMLHSSMPKEVKNIIRSWEYVSKSPYSYSFYDCKGKDWDHTPDGCQRISDHYNFYSQGSIHAKTDKEFQNNTGWALGKYNTEKGLYEIQQVYPFTKEYLDKLRKSREFKKRISEASSKINQWKEELQQGKHIGEYALYRNYTDNDEYGIVLGPEPNNSGYIYFQPIDSKVNYRYFYNWLEPYEILLSYDILPEQKPNFKDKGIGALLPEEAQKRREEILEEKRRRVKHNRLGIGTIIMPEKDGEIVIKFDDPEVGEKTLLTRFARLEPIEKTPEAMSNGG